MFDLFILDYGVLHIRAKSLSASLLELELAKAWLSIADPSESSNLAEPF